MEISSEPLIWCGPFEKNSYIQNSVRPKVCTYIASPPFMNLVDSDDEEELRLESSGQEKQAKPPGQDLEKPPALGTVMDGQSTDNNQHLKPTAPPSSVSISGPPSSLFLNRNDVEYTGKRAPREPHIDCKSKINRFPCLFCNRDFKERRARDVHLGKVHTLMKTYNGILCQRYKEQQQNDAVNMKPTFPSSGDQPQSSWILQCGMCPESFTKPALLHEHTLVCHNGARIIIKMPGDEKLVTTAPPMAQKLPLHRFPEKYKDTSQPRVRTRSSLVTRKRVNPNSVNMKPNISRGTVSVKNVYIQSPDKPVSPTKPPSNASLLPCTNSAAQPSYLSYNSGQNMAFVPVLQTDSLKSRLNYVQTNSSLAVPKNKQPVLPQTNQSITLLISQAPPDTSVSWTNVRHIPEKDQAPGNGVGSGVVVQTYQAEPVDGDQGGLKLRIRSLSCSGSPSVSNASKSSSSTTIPFIDLETEEDLDDVFESDVLRPHQQVQQNHRKRELSIDSGRSHHSDMASSDSSANPPQAKKPRRVSNELSFSPLSNDRHHQPLLSTPAAKEVTQPPSSFDTNAKILPLIRDKLSKLSKMSTHDALETISSLKAKISSMNDPEFIEMLKTLLARNKFETAL